MASSLRNLARRTVPKAPQPEPAPPSVTEEAPPVAKEPETVVTPPESESVSEGHVVQSEPVTKEASSGEATEDVVETEPEPEPTVEETPAVVSAPVEEVKVTTPSKKKKKAQKVATTGEASTDEKKEAETK